MAFIDETNLKLQHADSKKKKDIILKTGLKGECCLRRLSFHDRYLHTPAEPMHLIKNIVEHIVKLISGGWKPKALFSVKFIGMKSHSWKQLVSTKILKYCLRGLLGNQQRQSLFLFCSVLAQICAESINMLSLQQLEFEVHHSLSLLERDFPVSMFHACNCFPPSPSSSFLFLNA